MKYSLLGGKPSMTTPDYSVESIQVWPVIASNNPTVRPYDGGSYVIPAQYAQYALPLILDYVNGTGKAARAKKCDTSVVVIHQATQNFTYPVRYAKLSKPFVAVSDASKAAPVQVAYLESAGFISGQQYRLMSYAEANSISSTTCVSYITEPHFEPGYPEAQSFREAMKLFVNSGGNFLAECGGVGTYEQCDQDRKSPPDVAKCTGNANEQFFMTDKGLRFNPGAGTTTVNLAPDSPVSQFHGNWTDEGGSITTYALWNTATSTATTFNTSLNVANKAHWVVGTPVSSAIGGYNYYAAHAKLPQFQGGPGGNIVYLTGHSYDLTAGRRVYLNVALIPSNKTCKATVTLTDGTVKIIGDLQVDPCRYGGPDCNTVYNCATPHTSVWQKEGWDYGMELVNGHPLPLALNVTLYNRLNTMVIIDTQNMGSDQRVRNIQKTSRFLFTYQSQWNKVAVGQWFCDHDSVFVQKIGFTDSNTSYDGAGQLAKDNNAAASKILDSLEAALTSTSVVWGDGLRVIHLYTDSPAPTPSATLVSKMNTYKVPVIIATTSGNVAGYNALNLPRTTVVPVTWFDGGVSSFTTNDANDLKYSIWLYPVIDAQKALFTTLPISEIAGSDPIGIASDITSATINFAGQSSTQLTLTATTPVINFNLPGTYGVPGGTSFSPLPYTLKWSIGGTAVIMRDAIFWYEYAKAVPITATVDEYVPITVDVISNIRLSADTNDHTNLFLEVLNITKAGVNVWDTDMQTVSTSDGTEFATSNYYRTDTITFKTNLNKYGTYVVYYQLYDRCVRTISTITLTVNFVNRPPVGTNFVEYTQPGQSVGFTWDLPLEKLSDLETPFSNLKISWNTVTFANSGYLQVFQNGAWVNAVAGTKYASTTQWQFVAYTLANTNATFEYNVYDTDGGVNLQSVTGKFLLTAKPNLPPTISVSPSSNPTLITPQNTSDTFHVTVTDFLDDLWNKVRVESINVNWGELTTLRPESAVDSRTYQLFNTQLGASDVLISNLTLTAGQSSNAATFDFNWKPSATAPFGASYTFVLFSEDPRGLISNKVTVVLRTPDNSPPSVIGITSPGSLPTYNEVNTLTARNLQITLNDPDVIHTERLNMTVVSLPTLGALYYPDGVTAVKVGDVLSYSQFGIPTAAVTVLPLVYKQFAYANGTDTFIVRATDPAGATSSDTPLHIQIDPINWPPVSANVTKSSNGANINFTLAGSDPDTDPLTLTILDISNIQNGHVIYVPTGQTITQGMTITPTSGLNWQQDFTYVVDNQVSHVSTFTFTYTDPANAVSIPYTAKMIVTIPPPNAVDCAVSGWSNWTNCNATCGGGRTNRTRTVTTPASGGGLPCPSLYEENSCNTQVCPVDCVVSGWSNWTNCSASCGGGTQSHTRSIITPAVGTGEPCPTDLVGQQDCNTDDCPPCDTCVPVDCEMTDWSACPLAMPRAALRVRFALAKSLHPRPMAVSRALRTLFSSKTVVTLPAPSIALSANGPRGRSALASALPPGLATSRRTPPTTVLPALLCSTATTALLPRAPICSLQLLRTSPSPHLKILLSMSASLAITMTLTVITGLPRSSSIVFLPTARSEAPMALR